MIFFVTTLKIWANGGHVVKQLALKFLFPDCQLNFSKLKEFQCYSYHRLGAFKKVWENTPIPQLK